MNDEKIIRSSVVLQAGKGLTGPVVHLGPGVPWKDSVEDIHAALKTTEADLDGFVLMLRISAMMHRVRTSTPSKSAFLKLVGEVWDTIHPVAGG